VLGLEGYLDFCLAVFVNSEDQQWNNVEDKLNLIVMYALIPVIVLLPLVCYQLLVSHREMLDDKKFTERFGAVCECLRVQSVDDKSKAVYVTPWFLVRRLLFALLIVYGRFQTLWVQLAGNLGLVLSDTVFKIHFNK
jgi:hypothetical protein